MANEQGNPVGRDWETKPGELADRLGTPTADVREVITDNRQLGIEQTDDQGMIVDDDDGYVGPDGKMQPHETPLDVGHRNDMELDAENLDATEREEIESVRGIWES